MVKEAAASPLRDVSPRPHYIGDLSGTSFYESPPPRSEKSNVDEAYIHYWNRLSENKLPAPLETKIITELQRLQHLSPMGAEASIIKTYLETVFSLPWQDRQPAPQHDDLNFSKVALDLSQVAIDLDQAHFGLHDVKERVLEFLAVQKLTREPQGTILCLVGPPGVGKTSFARSIAESINRSYTYVPLGGVQDPAEIRGQRRTVTGANPGRIIQALERAASMHPVIVLDEIEKMGCSHFGDPEAALLEVLDPTRNAQFMDHYLNFPVDLSQVIFIATANSLYGLSRAMRDRLEVIRISGYTDFEKQKIAQRFILPKLRKSHGLQEHQLQLKERPMRHLIQHYTREAGVRDLERTLAKLCRKAAMAVIQDPKVNLVLTQKNQLASYLGVERFTQDPCLKSATVGVINGLAWTGDGGDMLQIESNRMPGKGKLTLTGSIGHVMLESAQAALSYIRSHSEHLGLCPDEVEHSDFHIHLPDGATPKDGPSAGMALAISIISSLASIPIRQKIGLTGEMTIRGRILPIGGLKEKCLAAIRSNIKTIIFPEGNLKDLDEMPEDIRNELTFIPVKTLEDALPHVLTRPLLKGALKPKRTTSRARR